MEFKIPLFTYTALKGLILSIFKTFLVLYLPIRVFCSQIESTGVQRNMTRKVSAHTLIWGFADLYLSGLFCEVVAFRRYSRQSRQDYLLSSSQCWSFPCRGDRYTWNFFPRFSTFTFFPFLSLPSPCQISIFHRLGAERSFSHITHITSIMKR